MIRIPIPFHQRCCVGFRARSLPCNGDTLLAQPADCGSRCLAALPAPGASHTVSGQHLHCLRRSLVTALHRYRNEIGITLSREQQKKPAFYALLGTLAFLPCIAAAAEWRVQPGESIANAIRSAKPGDTVLVERGYYAENLKIDKPLTLKGVNRPTISGGGKDNVISVISPDVTIEGLIIRDSGSDLQAQNSGIYDYPGAHRMIARNNDLIYNLFGLYIEKVHDSQAINNLIAGKRDLSSARRGNGIQVYNTEGARIIGNNISFSRDGIYVDVSHHAEFRDNKIHHVRYGTHYMNSYYNLWENNESYLNRGGLALMEVKNQTVRNNRAWGNSDHGIMLRTIQDSVIENNVVAGNYRGFFIYDAEYNTLNNNLVIGNRVGVHLWAGSYNNDVNANDFIDNETQVKYVATRDELWGKKQGNYWGNYIGWDRNGDGVGDVSYEANDTVDRLTWQHPLVKLLFNSPAIQTLRFVSRQFPLLRATSIIDEHPHMQPHSKDWSQWYDRARH